MSCQSCQWCDHCENCQNNCNSCQSCVRCETYCQTQQCPQSFDSWNQFSFDTDDHIGQGTNAFTRNHMDLAADYLDAVRRTGKGGTTPQGRSGETSLFLTAREFNHLASQVGQATVNGGPEGTVIRGQLFKNLKTNINNFQYAINQCDACNQGCEICNACNITCNYCQSCMSCQNGQPCCESDSGGTIIIG